MPLQIYSYQRSNLGPSSIILHVAAAQAINHACSELTLSGTWAMSSTLASRDVREGESGGGGSGVLEVFMYMYQCIGLLEGDNPEPGQAFPEAEMHEHMEPWRLKRDETQQGSRGLDIGGDSGREGARMVDNQSNETSLVDLETWLISLVKMKETRKPGGMAEKCGGGFAERRASGTPDVWHRLAGFGLMTSSRHSTLLSATRPSWCRITPSNRPCRLSRGT